MDLDIVFVTAGLNPTEVGKLVAVSRVTASKWKNKKSEPHHLLSAKVLRFIAAVTDAVNDKELPLDPDIKIRLPAIRKILLQKLASKRS